MPDRQLGVFFTAVAGAPNLKLSELRVDSIAVKVGTSTLPRYWDDVPADTFTTSVPCFFFA
jgi:hypothetical protein